jgi:hypothetical protein
MNRKNNRGHCRGVRDRERKGLENLAPWEVNMYSMYGVLTESTYELTWYILESKRDPNDAVARQGHPAPLTPFLTCLIRLSLIRATTFICIVGLTAVSRVILLVFLDRVHLTLIHVHTLPWVIRIVGHAWRRPARLYLTLLLVDKSNQWLIKS